MSPNDIQRRTHTRREPVTNGRGVPLGQLIALMPAAVYTCDAQGRLTFFNQQAAELWGREPPLGDEQHRFCGSFRLWRPNGEMLRHEHCPMAEAVREGRSARNLEVVIEQPSGKRIVASVNIDPLYDADQNVIGAINVFVDVTERKRAEAAIRASEAWLEAQNRAFHAAINGAPLAESLAILLRAVTELAADHPRCAFYLSDDAGTLHHVCGLPESYAQKVESLACDLAVANGMPVLTHDVNEEPRWAAWTWLAREYDYRACWSFPVEWEAGKPLGSFAMYHREPRSPTPQDLELATKTTRAAAILVSRDQAAQERTRAESAVRGSEEKYRGLFESIDTGYCIIEMSFDESGKAIDYRFMEANPAFEKQTGLIDAIGKSVRSLVPDHEEFWFETYGRIARSGHPERFEHRADALDRWYSVYAFPVGRPGQHRIAVLFEDIKERKLRELRATLLDEIGKDLARLSAPDELVQAAGAAIGEFLGLSGCLYCDVNQGRDEVTVHYGWTTDPVPNLRQTYRLRDYVSPEFERVNRAGEAFIVRDTAADERTDTANYRRLNIGAFVVVPCFAGGRWTAYFAAISPTPRDWRADEIDLMREVSDRLFSRIERARAELALRRSEKKYRNLFQSMGQAFVLAELVRDADGQAVDQRVLEVNPAFERLFGVPADIARNRLVSEWLPDLDRRRHELLERVIRTGQPERVEHYIESLGRWHQTFVYPGGGDRYVSLIEDITDRKRAEKVLRESEERFRQFAQASSGALWIRDAGTLEMEYASPAIAGIYGTGIDTLSGDIRHWASSIVPEDRAAALAHIEQARQGQSVVYEFRIQRVADQAFRWIRSTDFPLRDEQGRIHRIGGIAEDVTEQKLIVEHQGVLVAELQHRVRNIMAVIRSITARTGERAESVAEFADLISGRLQALTRVQARLTREARADGVNITAAVREEIQAKSSQEGQYITDGPDVLLSPKAAESLTLAVHELATNSLKYGALSVPEGRIAVLWEVAERQGVPWLSFDWSELGAPPPAATRKLQRGFGSELIEGRIPYELGGTGSLVIGPGGAHCHLEFPLRAGSSVLETGAPQRAAVFGGALDMKDGPDLGGRRVLVVEDEYYIASDIARALRAAGAEVLGPFSGEEAARAALEAQRPDAVIVDINLGHGPSFSLAASLRSRGIPFLFVTGYDEDEIPAEFRDVERLQKPVQLHRLVEAVATRVRSSGT